MTNIDASPLVRLLFDLYDRYKMNKQASGLGEITGDLASATGPEDVNFIQRNIPKYGLSEGGVPTANTLAERRMQDFESQGQREAIGNLFKDYTNDYGTYAETMRQEGKAPSPGDFLQQFSDRYSSVPSGKLGKRFAVPTDVLEGFGKAVTQGDAQAAIIANRNADDALKAEEKKNTADFLEQTSKLFGPTGNPQDKARGGFAHPGQTIADILTAAAAYKVPTPAVNDVLQRYNTFAKETYPPASRKTERIGRATEVADYNLFGERKAGVNYTEPKPKEGGVGGEKLTDFDRATRMLTTLKNNRTKLATNPMAMAMPSTAAELQRLDADIAAQEAYIQQTFPKASGRKPVVQPTPTPKPAPALSKGFTWKNGKLVPN